MLTIKLYSRQCGELRMRCVGGFYSEQVTRVGFNTVGNDE